MQLFKCFAHLAGPVSCLWLFLSYLTGAFDGICVLRVLSFCLLRPFVFVYYVCLFVSACVCVCFCAFVSSFFNVSYIFRYGPELVKYNEKAKSIRETILAVCPSCAKTFKVCGLLFVLCWSFLFSFMRLTSYCCLRFVIYLFVFIFRTLFIFGIFMTWPL